MPPSIFPEATGPILLVDDELELVEAVSSLLCAEFGSERVKATSDAKLAASWIEQERPSLLITDLRMPEYTGLSLLERSQQIWGPTPAIIISAHPSEEVFRGARRGHFAYLPKPFNFRSLLETIRQLEAAPPSSFRGTVALSTLTDLIQLYAISGRTGNLAVKSAKQQGDVFFEQGQIVHAQTGTQSGFEAFCTILQWPQGSFAWYPRRTEQHSIRMSVSELMLEAYRIQDEQGSQPRSTRPPAPPPREARNASSRPEAAAIPQEMLRLQALDGFLCAALVDTTKGPLHVLGDASPQGMEEALSCIHLAEQKQVLLQKLLLQDQIEDILITLGKQYHLIRPMRARPGVFFFLAVDRSRANLTLARMTLAQTEHAMGA